MKSAVENYIISEIGTNREMIKFEDVATSVSFLAATQKDSSYRSQKSNVFLISWHHTGFSCAYMDWFVLIQRCTDACMYLYME